MVKKTSINRDASETTHRHLLVVIIFMIAASLLVVLTTLSINMLTATGDFNQLLVRWSQNNSLGDQAILTYFETQDEQQLQQYDKFLNEKNSIARVFDELLSDNPDEKLIFTEFSPNVIHPNEITGLIQIFSLFSNTSEVQEIIGTWKTVRHLSLEKAAFVDSLVQENGIASAKSIDQGSELVQSMNREINNNIRELIAENSSILLLLKRFSLWLTVLLGIVIVLVGVIFTVRGMKSIRATQDLLAERDYLAKFPELNQFPVLNVSVNGNIGFINQAAIDQFPDLQKLGLGHPFLEPLKERFEEITAKPDKNILYEVEIGQKYYQQASHYLSAEKGIHVHSIDITKLKQQQLKLSHTLKEKELLLAEVHHRVKNNMAVISGLLELQEMMGENPESALSESMSRIKSMAIVHELLYQSNSFSELNTSQYLKKLGNHLRISLSNIKSVRIIEDSTNISLNINQAVPLGLLLNELAFYLSQQASMQNEYLELNLQLLQKNSELCLEISAPQSRIKNPLKKDGKSTLRMNLIKNLLAQIDGSLLMPDARNLKIQIQFSGRNKKGSSSTIV